MAKGFSDVQKKEFKKEIIVFSPFLYQKWIRVMLIQGKSKFLFEKLCNV